MRKPTSTNAAIAAVATAAVLAAPAMTGASSAEDRPSASASATRTVKVADDRYAPKRLKVARGTRVRWVWSRRNREPHNLYLDKRPKGVEPFHTAPMTAPFSFARKLRKAGVYKILCTVHEGMRMRIDVRR